MWRLAILLHVIIAPTIMGALMLAVMLVPLFQGALGKWILIESLIGFVVSAPVRRAPKISASTFSAISRILVGEDPLNLIQ